MLPRQSLRVVLERHHQLVVEMLTDLNAGVDIEAILIDNELFHMFVQTDMAREDVVLKDRERKKVAQLVLTDMERLLDHAVGVGDVNLHDLSQTMKGFVRELALCAPATTAFHIHRLKAAERWLEERPGLLEALLEETGKSTLGAFGLMDALHDWMTQLSVHEQDELLARFQISPVETLREALQCAELSRELDGENPFSIDP